MASNNDVQDVLLPDAPPASASSAALVWDLRKGFPATLSAILAVLIACFAVFTRYSNEPDTGENYMYFVHVSVMIFIGFGFLMTFLRRYSLGAVSLNLVASCMMALAAVLLVRVAPGAAVLTCHRQALATMPLVRQHHQHVRHSKTYASAYNPRRSHRHFCVNAFVHRRLARQYMHATTDCHTSGSVHKAPVCLAVQVGLARTNFDSLRAIPISIETLIEGLFCAGAGMVSFGALLGKVSPTQLVLLLLLEVPLFVLNGEILVNGIFGSMGAQV